MSTSETVRDEQETGSDAPNDVVLTDGNVGTVAEHDSEDKADADGSALNDENAMNPE